MIRMRPYISYSQLRTIEAGNYYERYILGEKLETPDFKFGSKVAEGLENPSKSHLENIEKVAQKIPTLPEREKEIWTEAEGIPIMGKLDQVDIDRGIIRDEKTSINKWTQADVDRHEQLTFYAMLLRYEYGIMPEELWIDWLVCEWVTDEWDNKIRKRLTGKVKSFKTHREISSVIRMKERVKKAHQEKVEIHKIYEEMKKI